MSTPHIYAGTVDDTEFRPLLEVPSSGVLKAVGVVTGDGYHDLRVTIDRRELVENVFAGTGTTTEACMGLGIDLRFESMLLVEGRDQKKRSSWAHFWIVYETDHSYEVDRREVPEIEAGRVVVYEEIDYFGDNGEPFTIRERRGTPALVRVRLERDVVIARPVRLRRWQLWRRSGPAVAVELAGEVVIEQRVAIPADGWTAEADLVADVERDPSWSLVVRAVGRTTPIATVVPHRQRADGASFGGIVVLPARGEYELLAEVADSASLSASFVAL